MPSARGARQPSERGRWAEPQRGAGVRRTKLQREAIRPTRVVDPARILAARRHRELAHALPCGVEEDDRERYQRVLHPEPASCRLGKDEEHPVLRRLPPVHEPDRALRRCLRDLGPEQRAVEAKHRGRAFGCAGAARCASAQDAAQRAIVTGRPRCAMRRSAGHDAERGSGRVRRPRMKRRSRDTARARSRTGERVTADALNRVVQIAAEVPGRR